MVAWLLVAVLVALVVVSILQSLQMNRLVRHMKESQEHSRATVETAVKEVAVVSQATTLPGHDLEALATRASQSVQELSQVAASMVDVARRKAAKLADYAKTTLETVRDEDGRTKQSAQSTVEESDKTLRKLDEAEAQLRAILGEDAPKPVEPVQERPSNQGTHGNARAEGHRNNEQAPKVVEAQSSDGPKPAEKDDKKQRDSVLVDT